MKRSRKIIVLSLLAIFGGLAYYLYVGSTVPPGQPPLAHLTPVNFSEFRDAFNEAKESVRVVTLLSPT